MDEYESNDFDEDVTDAQWDQFQQEERWQREDEALKRHGKLLEELRRESAAFTEETRQFEERVRTHHGHNCI